MINASMADRVQGVAALELKRDVVILLDYDFLLTLDKDDFKNTSRENDYVDIFDVPMYVKRVLSAMAKKPGVEFHVFSEVEGLGESRRAAKRSMKLLLGDRVNFIGSGDVGEIGAILNELMRDVGENATLISVVSPSGKVGDYCTALWYGNSYCGPIDDAMTPWKNTPDPSDEEAVVHSIIDRLQNPGPNVDPYALTSNEEEMMGLSDWVDWERFEASLADDLPDPHWEYSEFMDDKEYDAYMDASHAFYAYDEYR